MLNDITKSEFIIKCPKCDYEYLPGEIFIPNVLLGQPKEIERTPDGQICMCDGTMPELTEEFICEKCGRPFKVTAKLSFSATYDSKKDFSEDFSTSIYGDDRLTLKED